MSAKPLQSWPALCNAMDCSQPCSSVQRILQARILEWLAMPSSRGIFQTRGLSLKSPALADKLFSTSATWEALTSRRWTAKQRKKKETSFRRGHGPKKNKAFISTIVFSSIIKAAWICYRKSRETHRKLKHPWSLKNYHFYDNSNLFLLYIPTCPHTHTHTNLYDS